MTEEENIDRLCADVKQIFGKHDKLFPSLKCFLYSHSPTASQHPDKIEACLLGSIAYDNKPTIEFGPYGGTKELISIDIKPRVQAFIFDKYSINKQLLSVIETGWSAWPHLYEDSHAYRAGRKLFKELAISR